VVSSTPWPHFTPGRDPVPIVQEAGWVPGQVWTGGKSRPHQDSIPEYIYRVSQEEYARLREGVPYVKIYRYNPKLIAGKWKILRFRKFPHSRTASARPSSESAFTPPPYAVARALQLTVIINTMKDKLHPLTSAVVNIVVCSENGGL